jgi:DNA repair protein RecO (recombination protein O)
VTYLTPAIILKKYDAGDYDRQYLLYTASGGKVTAIAKGAKKITSKLNPHLDYFSVCELMLAPGASGIERLAGAGSVSCRRTKISRGKQFYGYYFLEAVDKLIIAKAKDEYVFALADQFLATLGETKDDNILLILNKYLFELLKHLGYEPHLKAKTQRQLFSDLNKLIEQVSEKKMNSFKSIIEIINC